MNSYGQRKRKAPEVSPEGSEAASSVVKENSPKRSYKRRGKAGECKPCLPENDARLKPASSSQSASVDLLNRGQSIVETTRAEELTFQIGSARAKIKLQLFPVNSSTRLILEKDGHNPFLELTVSLRKKISSITKHLNTKWGSSNAEVGEIMLFPYDVSLDSINSCARWTSNCGPVTAGEVHASLGSPAIFRLRYGWPTNLHLKASGISLMHASAEERSESKNNEDCNIFSRMNCNEVSKVNTPSQEMRNPINVGEVEDFAVTGQMPLPKPGDDGNACSVVPWGDSLTSLSFGGLLSEASLLNHIRNSPLRSDSKSNFQPIELVSDASVGALLSEVSLLEKISNPEGRFENKSNILPTQSASDLSTGVILCIVPSQSKSDNTDMKTEVDEAGCQLIDLTSELSLGGSVSEVSLHRNTNDLDIISGKTLGVKSNMEKEAMQSLFPWDDTSISLSLGGLFSEPSLQARTDDCEASVAAKRDLQRPVPKQQMHDSFSSILDGEETCHAFSFKTLSSLSKDSMTSKGGEKSGGCCNDSTSKASIPLKFEAC